MNKPPVPFTDLSRESLRLLEQGLAEHDLPAGSLVLYKGQPVAGAYFVVSGRLRVYAIAPNGNEATLYFIDPGETCIVALNCVFNDLLYPAWVQAMDDTRVAVIPGPVYRRLFEHEPGVRAVTVEALSTVVFRLMSELEQVHSTQHRQRLANFILSHANADGIMRMTQQQVAQHLGTTREVVARLMQGLVGERLVTTGRGFVRIADVFGLRAAVTGRIQR